MVNLNKILILNGPNINLLGIREISAYGSYTLDDIKKQLAAEASDLECLIDFAQSNHEGKIIDIIHGCKGKYDAIIINPGAYTHYSIAIRDAIEAVKIPTVEVHISNIFAREEFRAKSVIAPVCAGHISGFGHLSYIIAFKAVVVLLRGESF